MDINFQENFKIVEAVSQFSQYWNKFNETILSKVQDSDGIDLNIPFYYDETFSGKIHLDNTGIFVDDNNKRRIFYIKFTNPSGIGISYNYLYDNSFDYVYGEPLALFVNSQDNNQSYLYKERVFDKNYINIIEDFEERIFQMNLVQSGAVDYNLLQMQMQFYDAMHREMGYHGVLEIGTNDLFVEQKAVLKKLKEMFS